MGTSPRRSLAVSIAKARDQRREKRKHLKEPRTHTSCTQKTVPGSRCHFSSGSNDRMYAKKKTEGAEHVRQAEKALKTSLMKWTPDHDSAGDEFSKAATCFKVAKCHDEALDALTRACECYKECRSLYQAAKMLEHSVLICRDSNRHTQISSLAERGALLYRQHGSPESAAQLLEKAAKIMEHQQPVVALELYEKAAETIMVEDRPKQAAEYLSKVSRLQVSGTSSIMMMCTYADVVGAPPVHPDLKPFLVPADGPVGTAVISFSFAVTGQGQDVGQSVSDVGEHHQVDAGSGVNGHHRQAGRRSAERAIAASDCSVILSSSFFRSSPRSAGQRGRSGSVKGFQRLGRLLRR